MESDEKWYFTKEQLANTPSRKYGYDPDRELSCRQQAANFIQDMGQRLQVTQLCINTAIVYMHRFYVFHSFSNFHRNAIAAAALFLAAKVEEQPRKLEHVIKVAQMCLHREMPALDTKSEQYLEQAQDLVMNENVLLQTLGFDVAIDHPHTHVVRCCHLVKASKDLAQTSYFMASNSLHLTTMCLQYKPTVVACFCIHLACKWSNWEIPLSNEKKSWFWYVDKCVTQELLEQLTDEFLRIFDKCPSRLKRKISANQSLSGYHIGVSELNQKRLPGPGVELGQQGVSFQQPVNRGRPSNEDKKRLEGCMLPPPPVRPPLPPTPEFRKPPPPLLNRDPGYSGGMYHMGASTSQASSSHQPTSAGSQFLYPPQFPAQSANGPNVRMPAPPVPKHMVRPEAIFPPPKRGATHSSATITSRQTKQEPQPPIQQNVKAAHTTPHNFPRNGTHMSEIPVHQQIKHENMQMKYPPPTDKRSASHQKSNSKSYNSSRSSMPNTMNWGSSHEMPGRGLPNDSKYIKSDQKNEAFQQQSNYHVKMIHQKPIAPTVKHSSTPAFSSPVKQSRSPFSSPKKQPFSPPPFPHQAFQKSPLYSPPSKVYPHSKSPLYSAQSKNQASLYQRKTPPFSPPSISEAYQPKSSPFSPPSKTQAFKPKSPPLSPPSKTQAYQPKSPLYSLPSKTQGYQPKSPLYLQPPKAEPLYSPPPKAEPYQPKSSLYSPPPKAEPYQPTSSSYSPPSKTEAYKPTSSSYSPPSKTEAYKPTSSPFSPPSKTEVYQQKSPPFSPPSKKPFNQFAPVSKQSRSPPPFFSPKKRLFSPPMSPPKKHPPTPAFSSPHIPTPKPSQTLPITHATPKPTSKPSSIFSPDKVTPPPQSPPRDTKPVISPLLLSPLTSHKTTRSRTQSSGSSSEPELIPVMPKLEDISGFESIAKGKTAIKLPGKVSGPLPQSKEKKTGATLLPTVVKETKPLIVSPPQVPDVVDSKQVAESQPVESSDTTGSSKREHKKKKKHKEHREHKEHKDKDKKKDKHKEKHRDKDKDREKDKHRGDPAPIKITIPKDKIHKMNLIPLQPQPENASLKIKIPKDKLKVHQVEQPKPSGLKIKISKEALSMSSSHSLSSSKSASTSGGTSKKRERSSHKGDERHSHSSRPSKMAKTNGDHRSMEGGLPGVPRVF